MFKDTKLQQVLKRVASTTETDVRNTRNKIQKRADIEECFLCEEKGGDLREAMTMKLNDKVNECARTLSDGRLLAKLSAGDVVAQEMKYHPPCLVALYNRERSFLNAQKQVDSGKHEIKKAYPIAFSELVAYIMEMKALSSGTSSPPIFRLGELRSLYHDRLQQLGVESPAVHATRLKDQLLYHVPELRAHHEGRDIILAFEKDVGSILAEANKYGDAIHLARAAAMIRSDMLDHKSQFSTTFSVDDNVNNVVPQSLLQFVCMISHGSDIKSQLNYGASKSDIALSQLLQYNCVTKYKEGASFHRHSKDRETPFAVYVGLLVYAKTRKRQLIDILFENGISVSYDRVLEISAQLGDAVVAQYVEDGVLCPPALKKHVFTTAAVDNIDHNPSATTAQSSFHGTSLSLFQHPSPDQPGEVSKYDQM